MSCSQKSDFFHLNRFLNDRKLVKYNEKIDQLNNSDGEIKYQSSGLTETPQKRKEQIPLICLSLKKERKNERKLEILPMVTSPKSKETADRNKPDKNATNRAAILTIELCLDEKKITVEVFPKETAFDVVKRVACEKKHELFPESLEEGERRRKVRMLAEILQKRINDYIEELEEYMARERHQKFKVFKPKGKAKN